MVEEIGWRGYALDQLQGSNVKNYNPLVSSIFLGFIWWIWYIPLFFIKGSYQYEKGFLSIEFLFAGISFITLTFFMTFIYNRTNRSVLGAILIHFSDNLAGELLKPNEVANIIRMTIWILIAGIITIYWINIQIQENKRLIPTLFR